MSDLLTSIQTCVQQAHADKLVESQILRGELVLSVVPENILTVLKFLRDDSDCGFTQLIDICGVDYPHRVKRFDVVYHLLSMVQNVRIRLKVELAEGEQIPSATELFAAADWYEREAFDLYGILFLGHPDLRRLLTDYGFEGHPLRKDFPLTGHVEVRYDEDAKRVVYEPVRLAQNFRDFDFESPWEGVQAWPLDEALPNTEKAGKNADKGK